MRIRHQHHQTVNTHTPSPCRRQTEFKRGHEIVIDHHRLFITVLTLSDLIHETRILNLRIVQLGKGVRQLPTVDVALKTLNKARALLRAADRVEAGLDSA